MSFNEDQSVFGSLLGPYYVKLRMGPYKRPQPFAQTAWTPSKTIILPLPQELRDDTRAEYAGTELNSVGDVINGSIQGGVVAAGLRYAGGAASKAISSGGGAVLGAVLGRGQAEGSAAAKLGQFASKAVEGGLSELFPADQMTSALQQAAGMAPNPNPAVMFKGPSLNNFQYTWTLYPRSPKESQKIKEVIAFLKQSALPKNEIQGSASVLAYPFLCQINFFPWDDGYAGSEWGWGPNSIIRHKKCFMESVNVSYTPSNAPAFFAGDNRPVVTQITISFKEIEYLLSHDWGGEEGTASALNTAGRAANLALGELVGTGTLSDTVSNAVRSLFSADNPEKATL